MAKRNPSSSKPASAAEAATQPRPTQAAFEPMSREQLWVGLAIGFFCLVGAALGLGTWLDPSIVEAIDSADRSGQLWSLWLPFIFPVLVPISFYFFWLTWRQWRETRL